MKNVTSYEKLTDPLLKFFLETESEGAKVSLSLKTLDEIIEGKLRTKMWNKSAR